MITAMIFGASAYYVKNHYLGAEYKEYDYSKTDSLFLSKKISPKIDRDSLDLNDEKVDYDAELLDFSAKETEPKSGEYSPAKIDINSANLAALIKLPGIGEKTAQRIIKFRDANKKINNLNELLKVKGIGKAKLKELKKFLIIE